MEKYTILLGYYNKQYFIIQKLQKQLPNIDLSIYENRYVFSMKTQQLYTAIEDLLKQIARNFENHIEEISLFHKELLLRLHMDIPSIRPRVLSEKSFLFLDKLRIFRHFIRHAYDCELQEKELRDIQEKLKDSFSLLEEDLLQFRKFVEQLAC
ncbi:MAG: hypothetical protein FJZ58_00140 [Chlamydiae bacterium]|nr:hypothetical protein [Chlamydiota bacterium]